MVNETEIDIEYIYQYIPGNFFNIFVVQLI